MKPLKSCCCSCGCTLRTGSLITGSISLTIATFIFIAIIILKSTDNIQNNEEQQLLKNDNFPIKWLLTKLLSVYVMIASILLIIGAAKGYKNWLLPYIVSIPFGLILATPCIIFALIEFSNVEHAPAGLVYLCVILFLGGIALDIYLLMVVISHYYELAENEKKTRTNLETLKPGASFDMRAYPTVPPEEV